MEDSNQMDTSDVKAIAQDASPPTGAMVDSSVAKGSALTQVAPSSTDSLNGSWILDKGRGEWSMRGYLETLNVPELAIQANEKGENELDTIHTIELTNTTVKITKQSRVNNNLVVELTYGNELVENLKPDNRPKKQLATTDDPGIHLKIVSSLLTVNGMAHVTDTKRLVKEESGPVLVQELTISNPESGKSHTTTRYFKPHSLPPQAEKTGELGAAMEAAEGTPTVSGDSKNSSDDVAMDVE